MVIVKILACLALASQSLAQISCRNAKGEPVDWFVGYKLPKVLNTEHTGDEFLYADAEHPLWSTPENISSVESSVGRTLDQYYLLRNDPDVFYMMYNDAHPDGVGDSYRGHSKGTVFFDIKSGFWLIHSVPNFPHPENYVYPESGFNNGQSFLCITMNVESLGLLAQHFMYTMPSIYNSQLPLGLATIHPMLQNVIAKTSLARGTTVFSMVQELHSANGFLFKTFAKHKKFDADLYARLLAPYVSCSFLTETWPNGAVNYNDTCNTTNSDVYNIESIKIGEFITFPNTKDHSKWAVADQAECGYVCIGDINRQISQNKRAGGTVCFKHSVIWNIYRTAVNEIKPCPV